MMPATSSNQPQPIVILGPTAGGKTALAVELATRLSGEILSADSIQIYRHLNAGTAKPTPADRRQAKHHLIDIVEPTERFTVADWLAQADALINGLRSRNVRPIIVGGTNLYLKALLEGMFDSPPHDPALRAELARLDPTQLRHRLEQADPAAAERIHPNDLRRTLRALEVHTLTGRPISTFQTQWDDHPEPRYRHDPILIGLSWDVPTINQRINQRVKAMFFPEKVEPELAKEVCWAGEGLPDEVTRLETAGLLGPQAREALGYKQVLEHLANPQRTSLDDAYEQTKVQTRRFAKQQRTWLRRFRSVHWLTMNNQPIGKIADQAIQAVPASG